MDLTTSAEIPEPRLIKRSTGETVVEVTVRVAVDHRYYGHDRHWRDLAQTVESAIGERYGLEVIGEEIESGKDTK